MNRDPALISLGTLKAMQWWSQRVMDQVEEPPRVKEAVKGRVLHTHPPRPSWHSFRCAHRHPHLLVSNGSQLLRGEQSVHWQMPFCPFALLPPPAWAWACVASAYRCRFLETLAQPQLWLVFTYHVWPGLKPDLHWQELTPSVPHSVRL